MASEVRKTSLLRPNTSDHDYYHETYRCCVQNSNRYEVVMNWLKKEFDSTVVDRLSNNTQVARMETLDVLGVGSGNGFFEMYQLERLLTKFPRITACVVEPSPIITQYQDAVSKEVNGLAKLADINYEWRNETFQDFMGSTDIKRKFDFISVLHSVYFLGDPEEAIKNLYGMLKPHGMMIILVMTGYMGHDGIGIYGPPPYENLSEPRNLTNSSHIQTVLDKLKIPYTYSASVHESVDISSFMGETISAEGERLLDLIANKKHFRKTSSADDINVIMGHFRKNARRDTSDDGKTIKSFYECTSVMFSITA